MRSESSNQVSRHLKVISPGPLALVQDGGRTGYQQLGVSVSGAVDMNSLNVGNRLVGNSPDDAAVEITLGGAGFEFQQPTVFALTGAETNATLDGVAIASGLSYTAHLGSKLTLGSPATGEGMRTYLAIAGGIDTSEVLGSRSTHVASGIGGVDGRRVLAAGDVMSIGNPRAAGESGFCLSAESSVYLADALPSSTVGEPITVHVVLGPQDDQFSESGMQTFLEAEYVVTDQSNRQGLRLDGPTIESKTGRYDIVSDAVVNGSIQIPGDGKPIVLLADRQTTGGYAKIATVATVDLPRLGQALPGTRIRFASITVEEAQRLLAERSKRLLEAELVRPVQPLSLQVGNRDISVGVVSYVVPDSPARRQIAEIAEIDGVVYPISVE